MSDIDDILKTTAEAGIGFALGGSPFKTPEENQADAEKRYDKDMQGAKQALLTHTLKLIEDNMPDKESMEPAINTRSDAGAGHVIGYSSAIRDTKQRLIKAVKAAYGMEE